MLFSLLAVACIFALVSACSNQKREEGESTDPVAASAEAGTEAAAGTDAVPPAEGTETATATPNDQPSGAPENAAIAAKGSTDGDSKPKKSGRQGAKKTSAAVSEPAPPAYDASTAANSPAPITTQEPPVLAAPAIAQNVQPEQTQAERTPASPPTTPAAGAEELSGDSSGGGIMGQLMAYRTIIMAAIGIALVAAGGLAFWKKRQAAA